MSTEDNRDLRPDADDTERHRPPSPRRTPTALLFVAIAAIVLAALYFWFARTQGSEQAPQPAQPASAPQPAAPASAPASSTVSHPVELPAGTTALTRADIQPALVELLGNRAVASFMQLDDFPRRIAATIDNLGRPFAPAAVWPVQPTPGQFQVEQRPDGAVISKENAQRYTPLVLLVGTLDSRRVVNLYRRMYPLLQQAYRELGFGDRNLNDRLLEVVDLLLATPEPEQPPRVQLLEVKGPYAPERPWVRYQYSDPALESLASGQKILVRVGLVNERRLKQKLAELRTELLAPPTQAESAESAASAASGPASSPAAAAPRASASR